MAANQFDPAAINAATDIAALVSRYVELKRQGNEFVGRCLWHSPDEHPSMHVVPAKGFVHCFSCGSHADAIGFMQQAEGIDFKEACARLTNGSGAPLPPVGEIPKRELKKAPPRLTFCPPADAPPPDMTLGKLGAPSKTWTYRTAKGELIGYVARYEGQDRKKEIRCWSWGSRGPGDPERWECGAFSKPRPLYGLERLAPDKQVLIVEGEKAADAAASLLPKLAVVTWPGGAGAVRHADWSPLAGRSVVIWPDADDAGREAAEHLVGALSRAGAAKVKVLAVDTIVIAGGAEMPTPEGWDAADAKESAWTREETWAWARARVGPDLLEASANIPNPAPQVVSSQPPPLPLETGNGEQDAPPATAGPVLPEESPQSPLAHAKPADGSVPASATVTLIRAPRKKRGITRPVGNTLPMPDADGDALPPAFSQDALARELVEKVGEDWRYTASKNQWYKWNGATWTAEKTLGIFEEARAVCCAAANDMELSASMRRDLASRSTAASCVAMASWDRAISVPIDLWDADKWLLGTPGGVVDLRAGKMIEGAREQLITMSTSTMPQAGMPEVWLRCISQWCGADDSLIAYLQRLCGYFLTGETREQMLAFVHGPARSGKTTFIRHISLVMGDYAANAEMETFTESKQERHSSELARLRGKRLVYAAETEEGRRWAEARIKKLSGEDKVTARSLYENPEEFSPEFKLVVYGNHAPHLRNPDESIARRMHIIPFVYPVAVEDQDRGLDEKLRAEHGRILAWMIEGALLWQEGGLGLPEAVSDAVTRYMDAEDTFGDWLSECVDRASDGREASGALYKSYRAFIESRGESPVSQKRFSPKMEERGFKRIRTMGVRMFEGGRLRVSQDAQEPYYRQD